MKEIGNFFVKLNCKNVDNVRSLIIDRQENYINQQEKYIMCAGKYDKNGWTLNINPFMHKGEKMNWTNNK